MAQAHYHLWRASLDSKTQMVTAFRIVRAPYWSKATAESAKAVKGHSMDKASMVKKCRDVWCTHAECEPAAADHLPGRRKGREGAHHFHPGGPGRGRRQAKEDHDGSLLTAGYVTAILGRVT